MQVLISINNVKTIIKSYALGGGGGAPGGGGGGG